MDGIFFAFKDRIVYVTFGEDLNFASYLLRINSRTDGQLGLGDCVILEGEGRRVNEVAAVEVLTTLCGR